MSESTLRRIIIAVAVLIVAWLLVTLTRRGGGNVSADGELVQALHRLQQDTTAYMFTITAAGGAPIEITKSGGAWTVNGMPADSGAVERLRSAVGGATVGDLVSTSPANHERLGVGADSAWSLAIQTGNRTDTLLIGRSAQRTGYSYVRLPGQDRTWEVSGDLRPAVAHAVPDWRDKVMTRVDTTAIARIDIARNDTTYSLDRKDGGWTLGGGAPADSTTVHAILTELGRFAATSVAPDTATFEGASHRSLVAISTSGDTLADLEFAGREYIWRGRKVGDPTLYDVASYRIDRLTPKREDLAKSGGA